MLFRKSNALKLRFLSFKKLFYKSAFGELQLLQITLNFQTSCCNFKIKSWRKTVFGFFITFIWRELWRFTSKGFCFLLNKNKNFNKNKTESEIKTPTHSFREMDHVLQLLLELWIKSKTAMSWSSWKKRKCIFCKVSFVRINLFSSLLLIFF